MGYGWKKRQALDIFWSIVWPRLEKIGWKRIVGEGSDEGSMIFLPPGVETARWGKRNIEFFDKIKLVLSRLEERVTIQEGKILDLYRKEIKAVGGETLPSRPKRGLARPRLGVSRQTTPIEEVDTSWKEGRLLYPKSSSKVGSDYQVTSLPRAGTFETEIAPDNPENELIWSCNEAADKGMLSFIEDNVPYNKREKALRLVHENNYDVSNIEDFVQKIEPSTVSRWTENDKEKFRQEVFRSRKNLKEVCQTMGNKTMGDILAYYLGHYKKSDDYRLLKTVRRDEREEKARQATHVVDRCAICGEGGSLLICDGCESEWHMGCAKPALKTIPDGDWECDICVDRKFLAGRKRIIENMKRNAINQRAKREKSIPQESDTGSTTPNCSETPPTEISAFVIEAIAEFSKNINAILSNQSAPSKEEKGRGNSIDLPPNT
eukprot:jgi/Psemu1/239446/estExt_Genewise1.C_1390071